MKVRVKLSIEDCHIDETIEAANLEAFMSTVRDRVAKEMGWKGLLLKVLTPLQFAQESVKRYNEAYAKNQPLPQSLEEFLEFGQATGKLIVIEN
jgi:hypothetical protein